MPNILVTGGSGFIGSHLVKALVASGHMITNFDVKPPIEEAYKPFWLLGDILDKAMVEKAVVMAEPEIIFHLAANTDIRSKALSAFASIHQGTRNLLDVLERTMIARRLIHISTQLVVGPGYYPASDNEFRPYSVYGKSKAIAEHELRERDLRMEWTIVRPTNIWGPDHPSFAH